ERQRLELALAEIDADLVRFATYTQHKSAWRIAATLANKGLTLMHLERYEEGIAVCAEVVRLYGDRPDAPIQVLVAGALLQQGIALSALGRLDEALLAYDDLLRRFGDVAGNPDLAEDVAQAVRRGHGDRARPASAGNVVGDRGAPGLQHGRPVAEVVAVCRHDALPRGGVDLHRHGVAARGRCQDAHVVLQPVEDVGPGEHADGAREVGRRERLECGPPRAPPADVPGPPQLRLYGGPVPDDVAADRLGRIGEERRLARPDQRDR